MKTYKLFVIFGLLLAAAGPFNYLKAQSEEQSRFSGLLVAGYRFVDVGGAESKYDQHVNLQDGFRLMEAYLRCKPAGSLKKLADKMEISLSDLGGDPFYRAGVTIRKYGSYQFRYKRRKAAYSYDDILWPEELSDYHINNEGDLHTFNFDREYDDAALKVRLGSRFDLFMNFSRYVKEGISEITYSYGRDLFILDKPIDETKYEYSAGVNIKFKRVSFVLEERIRDYENNFSAFLPGPSPGQDDENEGGATELFDFALNMPYDFMSYNHIFRVIVNPVKRLTINAIVSREDLDMEYDYSEEGEGIGYSGSYSDFFFSGEGEVERDITAYEVELSYRLSDRWALGGLFDRRDLSQEGWLNMDGSDTETDWDYDIDRGEAGLQYSPAPGLFLSLGTRYQSRDISHGIYEYESEPPVTERLGLFSHVKWSSIQKFKLTGDYQYGQADDPYVTAAPGEYHRFYLKAKTRINSLFSITATALIKRTVNDDSDWESDSDHLNARAVYHQSGLTMNLGYSYRNIKREIDQEIITSGGAFQWPVQYEADNHILDGMVEYEFQEGRSISGNFVVMDNDESWPVSQMRLSGRIEWTMFGGALIRTEYRYEDYEEELHHFNDYTADIVEVSIGYRF